MIEAAAALLGGAGLFLLGMRLMTDGLKLAAGDALRALLRLWTDSAPRGFAAGVLVTAVVQSSSAVVVAVVGFVNAGLLTLGQAVWLIIGANVGTTSTSWLVALVGVKVDVGALALPLIGLGMLTRAAGRGRARLEGTGQALAGFGAFFLGVGVLQGGFAELALRVPLEALARPDLAGVLAFTFLGIVVTVVTQSSSAAVAVILTAGAAGGLPTMLAAAAVAGANVGTTSTAVFAALGATPAARRVAAAHILFNLVAAGLALILIVPLLGLSRALAEAAGAGPETASVLAVFHTLFNLAGAAAFVLAGRRLTARLERLFVTPEDSLTRPRHLDDTLLQVPDLAVRGAVLELVRLRDAALPAVRARIASPAAPPPPDLEPLARAIRGFVAELGARGAPERVGEVLPDLLRASHHLEELQAAARALSRPPAAAEAASPRWAALRRACAEALEPGADTAEDRRARAEAAYHAVKADLLGAAARGGLAPAAADRGLSAAEALLRCADLATKAERRLGPHVETLRA